MECIDNETILYGEMILYVILNTVVILDCYKYMAFSPTHNVPKRRDCILKPFWFNMFV